jgi:hypothetical protein
MVKGGGMKRVFNGVIESGDDYEFKIGDEIIAEELEGTEYDGNLIGLRYTTSNSAIDPETVEEDAYKTMMGVVEAEHGVLPFSEWTGFYGWDDTLRVGDHDLKEELLHLEGKHCYLEIWQEEDKCP